MRDLVSRFVARTAHDPNINWLIWRPAFYLYLYLYLFLLLMAIIALRRKNTWLLLIAARRIGKMKNSRKS